MNPDFLPSVSPIPFTLVIIFVFLVNCIASARLVTPLFQFYTQKLYWLKEWNKIFKAEANDGYITFYVSEPTTIPLNFSVKVVK